MGVGLWGVNMGPDGVLYGTPEKGHGTYWWDGAVTASDSAGNRSDPVRLHLTVKDGWHAPA
jgi:hypothetical protein